MFSHGLFLLSLIHGEHAARETITQVCCIKAVDGCVTFGELDDILVMNDRLHYFRPGEAARMLARCQFGLDSTGQCGSIITYPIKGYPWRRNPVRHLDFQLTVEDASLLFDEVRTMRARNPDQCLTEGLWSDLSEKGNGITRDLATNTLCYTLGIYSEAGEKVEYFSMKEDSQALRSSLIFRTVADLMAPYEASGNAKPEIPSDS